MKTALLVLGSSGLELARRWRDARPEGTVILGPSCVVGRCGGVSGRGTDLRDRRAGRTRLGRAARKVFPALWAEFDVIVGVMPLGIMVKLSAPLVSDQRHDPAVVAIDDAGRFVISVLDGRCRGRRADARNGRTAGRDGGGYRQESFAAGLIAD